MSETWTLGKVLDWTASHFARRGIDAPRLSAEMILAHVLNVQRIRLYTDLRRPMIESELTRVRALVKRAAEHEPIAYLVGSTSFYGIDIQVTRDVLIPRSDTETLVEAALTHIRLNNLSSPRVLELCTGSGCIAAAIAKQCKGAEVVATDISLPAVDVARANLTRLGLIDRTTLLTGDLFEALESLVDRRPFDLLLANPPYIATDVVKTLDRSVKDYEPHLALDGGGDGLDPHRRILAGAERWVAPGALLLLEIAFDQEEKALWIAHQHEIFERVSVLRDLGKRPRVLSLMRKSAGAV
jgi:release factor glutamine methyltransferase